MNYIVDDNNSAFQGMNRSACPTMHAEIAYASPLFLRLLKRVHDTGIPIHFSKSTLSAGGENLGSGPAVMYRDDNPTKPGEREGK